ncbi:hypothetical protein B9Z55_025732 [Caenorhabditis nigoni]|uniref:Uncharacterized protein n=1 Tax=Caenorhabditis nigoni TaxID=1611254 RepID=A0A2G5SZN7_9PELO|nr:hypothetical protein B9Z55_025732 [Caenorhabditis nigoni]
MKQYTQESKDQKINLRFILSSELRIYKEDDILRYEKSVKSTVLPSISYNSSMNKFTDRDDGYIGNCYLQVFTCPVAYVAL